MLLGSGCATIGTVQTARPIERGSWQLGVEQGVWQSESGSLVPSANVAARLGVTNRWDLGARVGTGGVGLSTKLTLTDPDRSLVLSLAPSIGGSSPTMIGGRSTHAQLPLLVGLGLGPHELTLTPKIQAWSLAEAPGPRRGRATIIGAGASVSTSVRIVRGIRLVPELSVVWPMVGRLQAPVPFRSVELRRGQPVYQATFGVLLGGERYWWANRSYRGGYATFPVWRRW
ncbi:MAG: hypothetical protein Q8P41_27995 [Pseudomonadota bacterium]|nr:hypothetical protein [Pseudomonadota bacterium]